MLEYKMFAKDLLEGWLHKQIQSRRITLWSILGSERAGMTKIAAFLK